MAGGRTGRAHRSRTVAGGAAEFDWSVVVPVTSRCISGVAGCRRLSHLVRSDGQLGWSRCHCDGAMLISPEGGGDQLGSRRNPLCSGSSSEHEPVAGRPGDDRGPRGRSRQDSRAALTSSPRHRAGWKGGLSEELHRHPRPRRSRSAGRRHRCGPPCPGYPSSTTFPVRQAPPDPEGGTNPMNQDERRRLLSASATAITGTPSPYRCRGPAHLPVTDMGHGETGPYQPSSRARWRCSIPTASTAAATPGDPLLPGPQDLGPLPA